MVNENIVFEKGKLGEPEYFRIVMHRKNDNKSFLEAMQSESTGKRTKYNFVEMHMTDEDLEELRDKLNSLEFDE